MKKYSLKTIVNYINGDEISDYDIDYLENNPQFMMEVINFSHDKNMYNLCSNEIKKDYEFIIFLIYKFKDDLKFLTKIVDDFISSNPSLFEQIEVKLAFGEVLKKQDYPLYQENLFFVDTLYLLMKQEIDKTINIIKAIFFFIFPLLLCKIYYNHLF